MAGLGGFRAARRRGRGGCRGHGSMGSARGPSGRGGLGLRLLTAREEVGELPLGVLLGRGWGLGAGCIGVAILWWGLVGLPRWGFLCLCKLLAFGSVLGSNFGAFSRCLQCSFPGCVASCTSLATAYCGPLCTLCRLRDALPGVCAGCLAGLLPCSRWAGPGGMLCGWTVTFAKRRRRRAGWRARLRLASMPCARPFLPTCRWEGVRSGRSSAALAELEHCAGNGLCLPALSWIC